MKSLIKKFIAKNNKGPLHQFSMLCARIMLRQHFFIPLLSWYVARKIYPLFEKNSGAEIRVLVLNQERFGPDLDVLNETGQFHFIALPSSWQIFLNSFWYSSIKAYFKLDNLDFYQNDIEDIQKARNALKAYLEKFIISLRRHVPFDAITTCAVYYKQDQEWARACKTRDIPFVTMHKECMFDPVIKDLAIKRYHDKNVTDFGHKFVVYNESAKEVFIESGTGTEDNVIVGGTPRIDALYHRPKKQNVKKQITFFSFHHCAGLLILPEREGVFSNNPNEGFYHYFDICHAKMAELASQNPDIDVFIKPKWMGDWADRITQALAKYDYNADKIPNLHIQANIDAQDLIDESQVIVGFNSTTLLEAKLRDKRVVVPLFAEAQDKYFDNHVYFQKHLDQAFNTVRNADNLITEIMAEFHKDRPEKPMPQDMIDQYIGFFDGKTTERYMQAFKTEIQNLKAKSIS